MLTSGFMTMWVSTTTSWPSLTTSPTHYIARPTTKHHSAGDCLYLGFPPNWGCGYHIQCHRPLRSIYPARQPTYLTISNRVGVSTVDADFFVLGVGAVERGNRKL